MNSERWFSTEAFVVACTAAAKITEATGGMRCTIDEINTFQELLKQQGFSILPLQVNNNVEGKWIDAKPKFKEECVFITATKYNRNSEGLEYDYACWQIKKLDGEDEKGNPAWYFGLLNGDGEEWGALEDLSADLYYIVPPTK